MAERDPRAQAQAARSGGGGAGQALALSTAGFAVTFWAWALLSPLGASLREELSLTAFQQSLLVAVPVIVGSLGRIPVGASPTGSAHGGCSRRSRCSRCSRSSTWATSPTR